MGHACEGLSFFLNAPCDAQDFFVDFGGGCKVPRSVVGKLSSLSWLWSRSDDAADGHRGSGYQDLELNMRYVFRTMVTMSRAARDA